MPAEFSPVAFAASLPASFWLPLAALAAAGVQVEAKVVLVPPSIHLLEPL